LDVALCLCYYVHSRKRKYCAPYYQLQSSQGVPSVIAKSLRDSCFLLVYMLLFIGF